jgi:hypothetical protein
MGSYLVVMDETEEARAALRFAARQAVGSGDTLEILALIPPQEFVQWSGVQAAMEEEAKLRAEAMVVEVSGTIFEEAGIRPLIVVRGGDPLKVVGEFIKDKADLNALVLGASKEGGPGPLVSHFAGPAAGTLPCPLIIVPATLGEASQAD